MRADPFDRLLVRFGRSRSDPRPSVRLPRVVEVGGFRVDGARVAQWIRGVEGFAAEARSADVVLTDAPEWAVRRGILAASVRDRGFLATVVRLRREE